jgi:hypothetical protein
MPEQSILVWGLETILILDGLVAGAFLLGEISVISRSSLAAWRPKVTAVHGSVAGRGSSI